MGLELSLVHYLQDHVLMTCEFLSRLKLKVIFHRVILIEMNNLIVRLDALIVYYFGKNLASNQSSSGLDAGLTCGLI